jgi:hypothetical protein
MPLHWTVHPSAAFVVLSVTDPHTFEEWRNTVLAMMAATSAVNPRMSVLVDRRQATPPSLDE